MGVFGYPPNLAFCLDGSSFGCSVVWPASGARLYLVIRIARARPK